MKTVKNTIEYQIRKQIEEREITPARDLWSEIENHTEKKISSKTNWVLVAACMILTISLGAVLVFSNKENQQQKTEFVKSVNNIASHPIELEKGDKSKGLAFKKESVTVKKNMVSAEKTEISDVPEALQKKELPLIKEHVAYTVTPISPDKIMAQADSAKVPVKIRKYTDPSTLLFSVEHKDAIEKTKGTSNVASIEIIEK